MVSKLLPSDDMDESEIELDEEESEMLEEIFDKIDYWFDFGGPLMIISLPLVMCAIRSRLNSQRIR